MILRLSTKLHALGGKDPQDYVKWLCNEFSFPWGGIPELKALSIHFQTEFAVVSIKDLEIRVFGNGKGYKKRVYLLHDGSHYNLLVTKDKKTFEPSDQSVYQGSLGLAENSIKKWVGYNCRITCY